MELEIERAIKQIDDALAVLVKNRDSITLLQYRQLRQQRHEFADFLVHSIKIEGEVKPKPEVVA